VRRSLVVYIVPSTDDRTEEFVKRLMGRTDIEDALGRLDGLMQDEVRMAAAQGIKATHEVGEKVQRIDDGVHGVNEKVQGVDDRVRDIDDKMGLVIYGAQFVYNQSPTCPSQWHSMLSD
jgi:hypothetical protein